jgi:hypothetical protein
VILERFRDRLRVLFSRSPGVHGDGSGRIPSAVGNVLGALTGVAIQMERRPLTRHRRDGTR